jgi:hypothetical protein
MNNLALPIGQFLKMMTWSHFRFKTLINDLLRHKVILNFFYLSFRNTDARTFYSVSTIQILSFWIFFGHSKNGHKTNDKLPYKSGQKNLGYNNRYKRGDQYIFRTSRFLSFWRETSQSPGTLIVDQPTNDQPTDHRGIKIQP